MEIQDYPILTIRDQRGRFSLPMPHKIFINGQFLGIMKDKSVSIKIPQGLFHLQIMSMVPTFGSETDIHIETGVENVVEFSDREAVWDILFTIDILLWIADLILNSFHPDWLPANAHLIYQIATNGYFAIWIIYELIIRKKYFKIKQFKQILTRDN